MTARALIESKRRVTGVVLLSVAQRRYLYTFVRRWNRDRVARGLPEMLANDALTEGLRALVEMIS